MASTIGQLPDECRCRETLEESSPLLSLNSKGYIVRWAKRHLATTQISLYQLAMHDLA